MLTEGSVRTSPRASAARASARTSGRRSRTKLRFVIAGLVIVAAIGYMIYAATQSSSEYFVTTGELKAMGQQAIGQQTKMGGRVVDGSVQWDKGANLISFGLTDGTESIPVTYRGIVPDSFQQGTDVIVEGKLGADGQFQATVLLAKCASKYTPAGQ